MLLGVLLNVLFKDDKDNSVFGLEFVECYKVEMVGYVYIYIDVDVF